jgi:hypothetical protein
MDEQEFNQPWPDGGSTWRVLFDHEDVKPYECDGLSAYRQVPMVVALPETEQQRYPKSPAASEDLRSEKSLCD